MLRMSDHERLTAIKAAAQAYIMAGRTDLIEQAIDKAFFDGAAAATTWLADRIEAERADQAAQPAAASPAPASGSIFGEPTGPQRDVLQAALQKRFEAMYPKRAG